jgi:hypothetical protein
MGMLENQAIVIPISDDDRLLMKRKLNEKRILEYCGHL